MMTKNIFFYSYNNMGKNSQYENDILIRKKRKKRILVFNNKKKCSIKSIICYTRNERTRHVLCSYNKYFFFTNIKIILILKKKNIYNNFFLYNNINIH